MSEEFIRNSSFTTLKSLTEVEMADWRRQRGARIISHRERYWEMVQPGFYQCVHWLARQSGQQATWPTLLCWGYRTSLREEEVASANAYMPVHLNRNVANFDLSALSSKRRNQVRSAQRQVEIFEVLRPEALAVEGYAAHLSATRRTGFGKPLGKEEYLVWLREEVRPDLRIVLAGNIQGKIGGYLSASAVEGTAYVDTVVLATETLSTNIGTGLIYELMQICRRSANIREVVYGLHSREDEALSKFKNEMGFPVVRIPCRVGMLPGAKRLIYYRKPNVHYRLFGE